MIHRHQRVSLLKYLQAPACTNQITTRNCIFSPARNHLWICIPHSQTRIRPNPTKRAEVRLSLGLRLEQCRYPDKIGWNYLASKTVMYCSCTTLKTLHFWQPVSKISHSASGFSFFTKRQTSKCWAQIVCHAAWWCALFVLSTAVAYTHDTHLCLLASRTPA